MYSAQTRFQVEVTEKKNCIYNFSDLGSRPRKIDLTPRMSNFIPSPNPSKSPLWNVLKVTLEPSDHLVWSWGPPGGHGLVGHLTHFQIFFAFFQSRIKKNSVHGRWVIGPLNRRISAQGIRNWSQIIFYFPSCWEKNPYCEAGLSAGLPIGSLKCFVDMKQFK